MRTKNKKNHGAKPTWPTAGSSLAPSVTPWLCPTTRPDLLLGGTQRDGRHFIGAEHLERCMGPPHLKMQLHRAGGTDQRDQDPLKGSI